MRKIIMSLVIFAGIIIAYVLFGKMKLEEFYCICGFEKAEISVPYIIIWKAERAGEKHFGIPDIHKHNHRWNSYYEKRQEWGGEKWHGESFRFELSIFNKIDNNIKAGFITKEIGERYKMLLVKDELENDAKNRNIIISEYNSLVKRG